MDVSRTIPDRPSPGLAGARRLGGWRRRWLEAWGGTAVLAVGLICCSGDTTGPGLIPPAQAFLTLALNYHAINLALTPPYDTVRLTTTARSAAGTVLGGSGRVTYQATDSTVTVDSTGLVTAHYVTAQTEVLATRTVQGVTQTDTAVVAVTPSAFPAPLATFSIQPMPDGLDSARAAVNTNGYELNDGNGNIPIYATIGTGNPKTDTVCDVNGCGVNGDNLAVYYWSSHPAVATIDRSFGYVVFHDFPDTVTFFVETYAYGVAKRDSLLFLITYPDIIGIELEAVPAVGRPGKVIEVLQPTTTVDVGATLFFETAFQLGYHPISDSVTFVFDDSTFVPSGPLEVDYQSDAPPGLTLADFPTVTGGRIPIFFSDTNNFFFELQATRVGDFTYHLQGSPGTHHIIVKSGI
jgi:hypothetical protein